MYETVIQISSIKYSKNKSIMYDAPQTTSCESDPFFIKFCQKGLLGLPVRYPDVYCITECVLLSSHYITTPQ